MKITELRIENFRCFKKAKLRIAPVTLITGANSAGKSSLVAPLLAWAQTDGMPALLSPNGRHVEMGGFSEMVHGDKGEIGIGFDVQGHPSEGTTSCDAVFGPGRASSELRLRSLVICGSGYSLRIEAQERHYQAKYRFGPSVARLLARTHEMRHGAAKNGGRPDNSQAAQIGGWLDWIVDNPEINIDGYWPSPSGEPVQDEIPVSDPIDFGMVMREIAHISRSVAPYYVDMLMGRVQNDLFFASNEIAKTAARPNPGGTLVVAHPETRLDTEAQARLADDFVKLVKEQGITFVAETHSEYLLTRLRRLVATRKIAEHDVSVAHVENAGGEARVHPVELRTDGRIVGAPNGFFETHLTDAMKLAMGE